MKYLIGMDFSIAKPAACVFDGKEYYLNQTCSSQLFKKCFLFFFTLLIYRVFSELKEPAAFLKFEDSNCFMQGDHSLSGSELEDLRILSHFFKFDFL